LKCPKCGTEFGEDITTSLGEERTCPGCGEWAIITTSVDFIPDYEPLEQAFLLKAREILGLETNPILILRSGEFFADFGLACYVINPKKGLTNHNYVGKKRGAKRDSGGKKGARREAMLALSVYLESSARFAADHVALYGELRALLAEQQREDLWEILEEKLPFVPVPPLEMLPEDIASPLCAYYTMKSDDSLVLGELYPSVRLSQLIKNFPSRYFCFFSWQGYTAFAFFNMLAPTAKFGFGSDPCIPKGGLPDIESVITFVEEAKTFKDLFVAIIEIHKGPLRAPYYVLNFESTLSRALNVGNVFLRNGIYYFAFRRICSTNTGEN